MTEVEQPPQNGIDLPDDDETHKSRPADIEQDMREMERRKRVEAIMDSRLFREELERIVDSQIREGGASGILQQLSDIVGVPASRVGSVFKSSNCVLPINDIRGVESMGYAKGEKILRCKLAATFRLLDLYGWTQGLGAQITARLNADQELFLVNPFGLLFHEVTASSLNKVDMQGQIVEHGTTNFGINTNHYILHSTVHAARPDIRCAIYLGCNSVVAVSSLKTGLLPLTRDAALLGEIATHPYTGALSELEEREKLVRSLGPISKVLLLTNHGALCCGETIEEAFHAAYHIVQACETQLKLLPVGLDNLVLIPEESRKAIYDASRRPPEGFAHLAAAAGGEKEQEKEEQPAQIRQKPKWRVGGAEFEALMRMLDNAGFRTGYIYRNPLVKSELPKPKNDVEVPPAVSSLGYLLEEEELYRQGIWKKGQFLKGGDRTRWLNSPNVYQKVEVLETGTPDPKKITKWVADGSPSHSTPVKIEHPLQFVPVGTNPKEFKRLQQQIKDNRRADKISAGPQSHILEGVTWDEANRIKDATVSGTGDHVVLMGAASKGIIQRGYQHNATVYKAPYAKNPFDNVTDDELNEYKKTVEKKKKNIHGEYTDTDFSESEALSSMQISAPVKTSGKGVLSETDVSEHQVMRIETKQAPKPSQPEVVLSDASVTGTRSKIHRRTCPFIDIETLRNALKFATRRTLLKKLNFLYLNRWDTTPNRNAEIEVFMIYKVNPVPIYTYPTNNDFQKLPVANLEPGSPPYRTLSHFGFNYPREARLSTSLQQTKIDEENLVNLYLSNLLKKEEILSSSSLNRMPFISYKEINFSNSLSGIPMAISNDDDESYVSLESVKSGPSTNYSIRRSFDFISEPESETVNRRLDLESPYVVNRKRHLSSTTKTSATWSEADDEQEDEEVGDSLNSLQIAVNIDLGNDKSFTIKNTNEITERLEKALRKELNACLAEKPNMKQLRELNQKIDNLLNEMAEINHISSMYRSVVLECSEKVTNVIEDIQELLRALQIE